MKKRFEESVQHLKVDIPELLSRRVVDTTINKIVFRIKEDFENDKENIMWREFVSDLYEYNDLERIHKSDTKFKSKYGKSIVGFDIWKKKPIIWFGDANVGNNQAIRINGMKQYANITMRTYSTINGGTPILRNQIVATNKTISYLFQGGFGVEIKDAKQIEEINKDKNKLEEQKKFWIPINWANLSVPQYIVDNFRVGTFRHNYGVLPVVEMLNKDFLDNDIYAFELDGNGSSDIMYSDWYPASDLIDLYNGFLQFFGGELVLDHTRIIGMFSQQDINNLTQKHNEKFSSRFKSLIGRLSFNQEEELSNESELVKKKLILRSLGGEGSSIEKMQTTLRGLEHVDTLDKLNAYIFKVSGYSWDSESIKTYENVSQTMNSTKGVYETTKEKISLFERQWTDFYSKIAFAWFKKNGKPFSSLEQCKKEFKEKVEFQIVSNVLQQENNDYQKVVELSSSGLISKEKAIKDLNPELSNFEVQEELSRIEEQDKKENEFNNFNRDFLGFEENENKAYDNNGDKVNE